MSMVRNHSFLFADITKVKALGTIIFCSWMPPIVVVEDPKFGFWTPLMLTVPDHGFKVGDDTNLKRKRTLFLSCKYYDFNRYRNIFSVGDYE